MKLFKNKRGNFPDISEWFITAVIISFALLISFTILGNFNTQVNVNDALVNESKQASNNFNSVFFTVDYIIPVILLAFISFSLVAARLIPSSSKFILLSVISMLVFPLVGMVLENWWDKIVNNPSFTTALNNLFFTNFIMSNMVVISLIYSFLIGIALYTKSEVAQ